MCKILTVISMYKYIYEKCDITHHVGDVNYSSQTDFLSRTIICSVLVRIKVSVSLSNRSVNR